MVVESAFHHNSVFSLEVCFERLMTHLDLIGDHNPVAIIARYHWDRVLRLIDGEPMPPLVWEINPSGICNIHCSFCLYPNTTKTLMPKQHFLDLVAQAKELGARAVIVAGDGEPMVHPDIEEMLYKVRDEGIDLFLFSNGTLIGRKVSPQTILETCTMVIWGLYASAREEYFQLTGSDLFDRVVENISEVTRLRNLNREYKPVMIGGWVATGSNYDEVEEIAFLGERMGLDWVYLRTDVTAESFTSSKQIQDLQNRVKNLKYIRFSTNPNFIQARLLFDRKPAFPLDDQEGSIALLYPGAKSWPMHENWLTGNDILYVGPNGDLRISNRNEIASGSNRPFVVSSTVQHALGDVLKTGTLSEQLESGAELVGQAGGRKALVNLFYNLVQKMPASRREMFREKILARYPETIHSAVVRNYF